MIVEDHAIVQQGLAAIINEESDITVVGLAKDGIEAIVLFRQTQPDVTVMDLRMLQMAGVEAISTICAEFETARIMVLTTYDGNDMNRSYATGTFFLNWHISSFFV